MKGGIPEFFVSHYFGFVYFRSGCSHDGIICIRETDASGKRVENKVYRRVSGCYGLLFPEAGVSCCFQEFCNILQYIEYNKRVIGLTGL